MPHLFDRATGCSARSRTWAMRLSAVTWAAGAGLAAWHLAPAATWLPPVRRWFPTLSGRGDPGHVALTFDDGPKADSTPHVLAALGDLGLHATFFMLGAAVAAQPELAEQIRAGDTSSPYTAGTTATCWAGARAGSGAS
jgi:peptidoglycan/xylan/chitin deacetylase (PgdA/CDA1 family)